MLASTMRATMPLSRGIMFNVSKNKNASIFDQMMGARGMAYMNRRKRGLYGKKETRYGNNVSHSLRRTRRVWRPNIQWKRVYSETLDEMLRIKMSTHAMRCIDKAGGLDNYILSKKRRDQDSILGEDLKIRIETILKARAERGDIESLAKLRLAGVSGYKVPNPEESVRELLKSSSSKPASS